MEKIGEAVYDRDVQIFMAPPHRMVPTLRVTIVKKKNSRLLYSRRLLSIVS